MCIAQVRALASYIASKQGGGGTGVDTLEASYSQFIADSKRRVEAQTLSQGQERRRQEQLWASQAPAARSDLASMARVSAMGGGSEADAVAAQLARAREVATTYSGGAAERAASNPQQGHDGASLPWAQPFDPSYEDARGHIAAGGSAKLCGVGLKVKVRGPNVEVVEIVHGTCSGGQSVYCGLFLELSPDVRCLR